jgi:hypothetical protein
VLERQSEKRRHPLRVKKPGFQEPRTVKVKDWRISGDIYPQIEDSFSSPEFANIITAAEIKRCLRSGVR